MQPMLIKVPGVVDDRVRLVVNQHPIGAFLPDTAHDPVGLQNSDLVFGRGFRGGCRGSVDGSRGVAVLVYEPAEDAGATDGGAGDVAYRGLRVRRALPQ